MPTLYEHPLSPYSRKVKIVLREKGMAATILTPDGMGVDVAGGAFGAASPLSEVPAFVLDDGTALFGSAVILDYLEDICPDPPLMPADPIDRARVRMIEQIVDTQMEAINWGLMELHVFKRGGADLAPQLHARAEAQLGGFHAWLERQLDDRDWFSGPLCGRGDLAVHSHCLNSSVHGVEPPSGSRLAGWYARMNDRPQVRQATEEALAAAAAVSAVLPDLIASGVFKRQYRDHRLEWMIRSGGMDVVTQGMADGTIRFSAEIR